MLKLEGNLSDNGRLLLNNAHLTLYRIFQAAMNNIIRHSEASKVRVEFRAESDCVLLIVRDHGKGFEPKRISHS